MLGNMAGGGGMGMGMNPAAMMPPPIVNSPSVPPAAMNQTNPSMPMGGNFFQDIMKAVFDPSSAAKDMAASGLTPEQFTEGMKTGKLSNIMSAQQRPASVGDVYTKNGTRIIQSGEGVYLPSEQNEQMITLGDLIDPSKFKGGDARLDFPGAVGNVSKALGGGQGVTQPSPWPNIIPTGTAQPIAPPMLPPQASTAEQVQPIVPPILPPEASQVLNPLVPDTLVGQDVTPSSVTGTTPEVGAAATPPAAGQVSPQNSTVLGGAGGGGLNLSGNRIFTGFMDTVHRGGLTNPNGLAAVAATGKSESAFDPKNAYGSWNDPSEKGVAGTSGGILSWRAARFDAMRKFVKDNGGDPSQPSPELQAKFFLQENPALIKKLQNAKTPEEAQQYMNEAWQFAGWNRPGGERDRRIALARNMVSTFGGKGGDGGIAGSGGSDYGAGGTTDNLTGAGATGVPPVGAAAATSATSDLMGALDSSGGSASQDLNLPDAPSPVAPRPGGNPLSSEVMKTILAMLAPQMSGNASQIPTLSQLMSGR